jgi:hypothetical protein
MVQNNTSRTGWWGRFEPVNGETISSKIGPLKLAVQRLPNEWQIAYQWYNLIDPTTGEWSREITDSVIDELNYATVERYVIEQTEKTLHIMPALADRSVITRPFKPFFVLPGDQINVFVSSPLWVRLETGDPPQFLQEIPIHRPSDTWFGPSTMTGELCYAGRTHANLNLENVLVQAHRAITQVAIQNQADTQLHIERLNLPVPYLSLFETAAGTLWTEAVTMVRTRDTGMASLQVEKGPPDVATEAKSIFDPRERPPQNMAIRAFGVLFG